ncbi:MAG: MltA domain-containing protein [bacterium]
MRVLAGRQQYRFLLLILFALLSQAGCALFPKKMLPPEKAKPPVILTGNLPIAELHNRLQLNTAIERQLHVLNTRHLSGKLRQFAGQTVPQDLIVKSLLRFQELVNNYSGEELNRHLLREFDIYQSTGGPNGRVLFTGYYTPCYQASRHREGAFQYPLYSLPANYQILDLSPLRTKWKNTTITVYVDGNGQVRLPPSRREIEEHKVYDGQNLEIAWLSDPLDAFLAQVQGSLIVEYPDGQRQFLNYAGKNGYEYTSLGKELYQDGHLKLEEISIASIRKWFRDHPASLNEYLNRNDSYVYFVPQEDGPYGAGGAVVTEWASIATDKRIFPAGGIALIDTRIPMLDGQGNLTGWRKHTRFVIDQDTGGAIIGPGRVDIYMGAGEQAGCLAGYQKQEGSLYYLLLRAGK